jgi:ABC-type nitrate/sulfonate/bicarbonate transport system substrate-binding protein
MTRAEFVQLPHRRTRVHGAILFFFFFIILLFVPRAAANPYLPRPGERNTSIRIATCAVSGGFIHLYTALENKLFEKYGFKPEHVYIRGSSASLAALVADEIQFLYCAAEATMPALAAGMNVKLIAAPLIKLPFVLVARKEIRRVQDLRGKSLGVVRPGDLSDRLSRMLVKKLNIPDVTMRPIGGSQSERFQAMAANIVQGVVITPPLDVRAKKEGYNVIYRLIDLDVPFIYSSLHASAQAIRERAETVQRFVATLAEAIHFADRHPAKAKRAIARVMRLKDDEALQVSYDVYTKEIVDRRMIVPAGVVSASIELYRSLGMPVKRKAEEIYDNSFVTDLEKSGFQRHLWGN